MGEDIGVTSGDFSESRTDRTAMFTGRTLDFVDERSGFRMVAASPTAEPALWELFLTGAVDAYRRHEVETALEYDVIADGTTTVYFFAALAADDSVVGGSRAIGPYLSADEAHPMVEWSDPTQRVAIREVLAERVPHGLVESKSGWIAPDAPRRRELGAAVARTATYSMELLGARYMVGTSADNALEMWQRAGGQVVEAIPPCPYPDSRYRTRMLLWDVQRCASAERTRELARLRASAQSGWVAR